MHLGRYIPKIILGLGAVGVAAAIACSGSGNEIRQGYITTGQRLGNSEYIFEAFYADEKGELLRDIDDEDKDLGFTGYFISDKRPEKVFPFIVGAYFPGHDNYYCITKIEIIPPKIHYEEFSNEPTREECPYLPEIQQAA